MGYSVGMESEQDHGREENIRKVPATLGVMIGFFLVIAAIGIILLLVL